MSCRACRKQLPIWLDGELPAPLARELEAHLGSCPSCAAERVRLEKALGAVDAVTAPPPSAQFDERFREKLARARVEAAAQSQREAGRAHFWRLPALGGVAAALLVMVMVGVLVRPGWRSAAPRPGELELARHLDLLRDYDVVTNLDALEDFEVVSKLDALMEESR